MNETLSKKNHCTISKFERKRKETFHSLDKQSDRFFFSFFFLSQDIELRSLNRQYGVIMIKLFPSVIRRGLEFAWEIKYAQLYAARPGLIIQPIGQLIFVSVSGTRL